MCSSDLDAVLLVMRRGDVVRPLMNQPNAIGDGPLALGTGVGQPLLVGHPGGAFDPRWRGRCLREEQQQHWNRHAIVPFDRRRPR